MVKSLQGFGVLRRLFYKHISVLWCAIIGDDIYMDFFSLRNISIIMMKHSTIYCGKDVHTVFTFCILRSNCRVDCGDLMVCVGVWGVCD